MSLLAERGAAGRSGALATLPYGGMTRIRFEGYLSPASGVRYQASGIRKSSRWVSSSGLY
jgi:hypothetical protein